MKKHILLVEPYFGGSHRAFLEGIVANIGHSFTVLTLPARKWKMRMQVSAPWMAHQVVALYQKGEHFDGILCSPFIDVAVFRSLLVQRNIKLPIAVYFHENQFAYPGRTQDPALRQFLYINWTTALAADRIFFNSNFNFESFLSGISRFLKKSHEVDLLPSVQEIRNKSVVLYPGIDFGYIDATSEQHCLCRQPVIVWNHRWEHDKDPETFFQALFALKKRGIDFKLIVLGQCFQTQPQIFSEAQAQLSDHLLHFGFTESRKKYASLLRQADLVVSTSRHEFFGISVLEAVRAGCRPLVPDRLSYPELFPKKFRYVQGGFFVAISAVLRKQSHARRIENRKLAAGFSWPKVATRYSREFFGFCEKKENPL